MSTRTAAEICKKEEEDRQTVFECKAETAVKPKQVTPRKKIRSKKRREKQEVVATIRRGNRSARMSGRIAVARNRIAMKNKFPLNVAPTDYD